MVEAFREGSDIHAATAAKIWHEDIKEVTDAQRKKQKLPTSASSTASRPSVLPNA